MASSINASLTAGLVQTADTSGIINLQSGGTTVATISSTGLTSTGGALNGSLGATTPSTVVATDLTTTGNTILGNASTDTLNVGNGGLIKDASGNLGLGVTPSAWNSGWKAYEIQYAGNALISTAVNNSAILSNAVYISAGWRYGANGYANGMFVGNTTGQFAWLTAPSGTAGNAITFTQAMTLDANGAVMIGTTTPLGTGSNLTVNGSVISTGLTVSVGGGTNIANTFNVDNYIGNTRFYSHGVNASTIGSYTWHNVSSNGSIDNSTMTLDASGNLLVGQTSGSFHIISKAISSDSGDVILSVERQQTGVSALVCYGVSQTVYNAANSAIKVGRVAATLRSINAGGTINASGADYAEYMTKANDFVLAKGDVVGIDANGKLTNVYADAISFCVKSTDPSYVGGDTWGTEEAIGLTLPKKPIRAEDDTDETFVEKEQQYSVDKAVFDEALETARQLVDRIAFAGQVPVNVLGATAGQYIIPVNDNGAIKGEAVSSPTFEQYQTAVGKVIAIENDGRARIIVKVA